MNEDRFERELEAARATIRNLEAEAKALKFQLSVFKQKMEDIAKVAVEAVGHCVHEHEDDYYEDCDCHVNCW